ncbi:MAG: hypothetical protein KKF62_08480 [Bacteroidetes bacterium]|nr:hypothetical protein [Bacteroidota bacterium]MBU1117103.1 hypothetical protein [Bacteroidota bacterium]MBU1799765.1 hypothetical protein [Bacteroidota bacterium]
MNEEKFTDDNEFSELKKLLKEIPKITAPDNFEFNLMTRIQNKNFEIKSEKKKSFFSWSLTPAIAFAATVFVAFFVLSDGDELGDNPWQSPPQLIENQLSELDVNQPLSNGVEQSSNTEKNNEESNLVTHSKSSVQKQFPFDAKGSFSLDEDIHTNARQNFSSGEAHLANSSNENLSSFDGFFLREVKKLPKADSLNKKDSTSNNYQK